MTYTPSASNVMLGRGAIYFDRRTTTDNTVGSFHLGNCDSIALNVTTETLDMVDYTQQSSSPYKSVVVKTDVAGSITGFEFSKDTMALATMGTIDSTYSQTNVAVTGEVLASATVTGLKGRFFQTAYRNISTVVLKQGATTHVLNTDYTIADATRGIIKILTTGAVADGTALTIDYAKATITAGAITRIFGGVNAAIEGKLRYVSNNTTGPKWDLTVFNANVRPNGDITFISDEFNKFTLEFTAQSDASGTYGGSASSPYYTLLETA
jgi:hypothetical protein